MYTVTEWLTGACTFGSAALGVITGIKKEDTWIKDSPSAIRLVEFLQEHALILYAIICAIVIACFVYRRLGNPWVWEKIQFILDEYQDKAFNKEPGDATDHHRVTLFEHKKNCIFRKHWSSEKWYNPSGEKPMISSYLVPVKRSGHISQNSTTCFYVSDNSDDCESVAAKAWSSNQTVIKTDLPLINTRTVQRDLKSYATDTYTDIKMLQKWASAKKQMPRSIAAVPVMVSGEIWGVIVLDSRLPNGVTGDSVLNYQLTVALVGHLLEKA